MPLPTNINAMPIFGIVSSSLEMTRDRFTLFPRL